jgi:protein AFG1
MSPLTSILLAAGLAMQANAATVKITVGQGGLNFSPNEVKAAVGDVLEFHYVGGNHSVVQGDFDNPCNPATTGGFFSGYLPATNGENVGFPPQSHTDAPLDYRRRTNTPQPNVFRVTVNNTDPIAYYCSQKQPALHCPNGMVGVVNPTNASSFANYAAAAKNAQTVAAPPTVFGGVLGPAPQTSTTGSPTAGASSTATPTSTTKNGAGTLGASFCGIAAAVAFAVYLA